MKTVIQDTGKIEMIEDQQQTNAALRYRIVIDNPQVTPQIKLLQLVTNLSPGEAVCIPGSLIRDAAHSDLTGIDRMQPIRSYDVKVFLYKIEHNWDIDINIDTFNDTVTLQKPVEQSHE